MNTDTTIWMPLYIGDLQAKFTRLSSEQVGATLFLMMDFWKNGPIPCESHILMSVTKLTSSKTKSLMTTLKILNLFEEVNGFIQSNYFTALKEQAIRNQKMKSERGKAAAEARWNKTSTIAQTIMNSWSIADQSEEQWINFYADFDLLIIDEYGLHDRHATRLELIHKVLYRRYDLMKPTVIISNFTLDALETDLGMRLWSRLHESQLITVPCYWSDHRMK